MIIQCPACSTKFSIDPGRVRGIANPRFHCSRCDHYFDLSGRGRKSAVDDSGTDHGPTQLDFPFRAGEEVAGEIAQRRETFAAPEPEDLPLIAAEWPTESSRAPFEADVGSALSLTRGFATRECERTPGEETFDTEMVRPGSLSKPSWSDQPIHHRGPLLPFAEETGEEIPSYVRSAEWKQRSHFLPVAAGPILLCALFLALGTASPTALQKIIPSADLPRIPPGGMEIVDLHAKSVTLDTGEKALDIRGRLLNSTEKVYRDVTVEAELFSQENEELLSLRVPLRSRLLETTNIHSLDRDAIENLESSTLSGPQEVEPGAEVPFRIVFANGGDAAWFGARVLSVRTR